VAGLWVAYLSIRFSTGASIIAFPQGIVLDKKIGFLYSVVNNSKKKGGIR